MVYLTKEDGCVEKGKSFIRSRDCARYHYGFIIYKKMDRFNSKLVPFLLSVTNTPMGPMF
jgi:hypothetical protein